MHKSNGLKVLPTSLLTMCCAPMPFVVGILSSSLAEVLRLPLDEVLILDIDHNKMILSPGTSRWLAVSSDTSLNCTEWTLILTFSLKGNDIELLPPGDLERLFSILKSCAKLVRSACARCFLCHTAHVVAQKLRLKDF